MHWSNGFVAEESAAGEAQLQNSKAHESKRSALDVPMTAPSPSDLPVSIRIFSTHTTPHKKPYSFDSGRSQNSWIYYSPVHLGLYILLSIGHSSKVVAQFTNSSS